MSLPAPEEARRLSDEAVLRRVSAGDTELFELLMRRHNQKVYRTIRAILRNESEVEDAMQQTYLAAFAHLGQFVGTARFSTWLLRIAINEALGRRRARLHLVEAESHPESANMESDSDATPEDSAARHELGGWLGRAIDELPEIYRIVLMLRDVEEMTTAEAAETLQLSEDAVKTRLSRARGLLRDRLEREMTGTAAEQFQFHASRCDRVVAGVWSRLGR